MNSGCCGVCAAGRDAVPISESPYHFTQEEAQLVGRYRFYFAFPATASDGSSMLAPLMALRAAAAKGDCVALRALEIHDPLWEKIRAANRLAAP